MQGGGERKGKGGASQGEGKVRAHAGGRGGEEEGRGTELDTFLCPKHLLSPPFKLVPPPLPPLQTSPLLAYVPTCYPELVLDIVAAYRASEHPFASPREVGVCVFGGGVAKKHRRRTCTHPSIPRGEVGVCLGEGWLCINLLPYSMAVYFPLLLPSLLPCLTHGP